MANRTSGQFTFTMLPRLSLFSLLIFLAVGGFLTSAQHSNVLGLRRFVDRVRIGASGSAVGNCMGADCSNRSSGVNDLSRRADADANNDQVGVSEGEEEDGDEEDGDETAVEEGRGRKGKKKKGHGKMFLLFAAITKATMLYIMIHAVAAVAGKALIVAKVALAIATALALKKSLDHKTTSYEIVKHPQYSHVQSHSSSIDYDHGSGGGGYEGGSRRKRRTRRR